MRKITFENSVNGLSATFASDNPKSLLESFDGCSCGAEAITYRPLNFDGQRFVSSTLTARTIQFTASFGGIGNGRYSQETAIRAFEQAQRVFVPGQPGTLTWTDGRNTRFIKCRAESAPLPSEVLPFLLRADFTLTADNPLWFDSAEHVVEINQRHTGDNLLEIYNPGAVAAPFMLDVEPDLDGEALLFVIYASRENSNVPAWAVIPGQFGFLGFSVWAHGQVTESYTFDTANCTVTSASGELCNQYLAPQSIFFDIMPGYNYWKIPFKPIEATLRWHETYLGVI